MKDDRGFCVWSTQPAIKIDDQFVDVGKGDRVRYVITVTPSDRDTKFGFGKRPGKVSVLERVEHA